MESYSVFHSAEFDKKLQSMPKDFLVWVDKIETQLIENPFVGKPLGYKWFREKKFGKYRIYYLIYEEQKAVNIITLSDKKGQQYSISNIKRFFDLYKEEIIRKLEEK